MEVGAGAHCFLMGNSAAVLLFWGVMKGGVYLLGAVAPHCLLGSCPLASGMAVVTVLSSCGALSESSASYSTPGNLTASHLMAPRRV